MSIEKIIGVVSSIITVLTSITVYYSKSQKRRNELNEKYFTNILVPFIKMYKKDEKVNAIKFIKDENRYQESDYYIPQYIIYLANSKKKDLLKKILIVDYELLYPNRKNNSMKSIILFFDIITYIGVFLLHIMMFPISYFLIFSCVNIFQEIMFLLPGRKSTTIISNIEVPSIFINIITLVINLLFTGGLLIAIKWLSETFDDDYSFKTKKIKRIIKSKEKKYDKMMGKYYI